MFKVIAGMVAGLTSGLILFSACINSSSHLLVKIEGRDSITVKEFQSALSDMGAKDFSYEEKRKIALNMIHERLKALSAVDEKIDQQDDVKKMLLQYRDDLLRDEARNRYIYPKFLNDSTVEFHMNHAGHEVEVKNFVYRYKDNPRSKVTRTREEARRFVDSIYSIADKKNFDTLTFQYSEYIDRQTGRGNYRPDRLKYGTLPFQYETVVFRAEAGSILKPIEIQGAFLIPWIVKFKYDSTAVKTANKDEARKQLRKKIETVDAMMMFEYYRSYADTLLAGQNVRVIEPALDTFIRVVPADKNIETILQTIGEKYHSMVLVDYPGQDAITFKSFLSGYDMKNVLPKLTRENLNDIIREQLRDKVLIRKITDEGYPESTDFQIAYSKKKNALLIQRIQPSKLVRPDSVSVETLRRYYENHIDEYQIPGTIKIQEVFSTSESVLKQVAGLCAGGIEIGKAADSVKALLTSTSDKQHLPVVKPQAVIAMNGQDELTRAAAKIESGELTPVISRQGGGYSIVRVLEKKETVRQSFDTVRKKVETMVINDELRKQELRWLNDMKKKLTVILYEQNLK